MKYKFIGKPDKIFPFLKTNKVYDLEIKMKYFCFLDWLFDNSHPMIVLPFRCGYSSWKTFYQNWRPL